jgi:phosphatidate cytidylyltransferase
MLVKRIIFSILALAMVSFAIFNHAIGRPLTLVMVAVLMVLAIMELAKLMKASNMAMPHAPVIVLGLLLLLIFYLQKGGMADAWALLVVFCAGPILVTVCLCGGIEKMLERISLSAFALLYVIIPLSLAVYLRGTQTPSCLLLLVVLATIMTDTGAFFIGRSFGKHKLAPTWSPKKTWEGSIGGVATALLSVAIVGTILSGFSEGRWFFDIPDWGMGKVLVATLLFSVFGQIGDLAESMLKRHAGVKDSGNGMMGHGGILDRLDSHLFNLPLAAALNLIFA